MGEFLSMGGYGAYVWPSILLSVATMAGLVWQSLRRQRALLAELERLEAAAPSRRRARKNAAPESKAGEPA